MRAAAVLILWCAVAVAEPPPSPIIYPAQRLPLSFSHAQHLALPDVACGTCHVAAATSIRAADVLLPREAACAACHAIDRAAPEKDARPAARCDACHVGAVEAATLPAPNLRFNHKIHVERGVGCADCHDVAGVGLATREQLPRMRLCLGCHDGERAPAGCTTCHLAGAGGRVRTDLPEGRLVPSGALRGDAHDLRFRVDHARVAAADERYCAACHARGFCQDCHSGRQKPLDFHAGDYVALHAGDARREASRCQGCHRLQTFCTGCHARSGVSDDARTSQFDRESRATPSMPAVNLFHPAGWKSGHAVEAGRNVRACASCHRESFCIGCHSASQTPTHPPGWRQSARCRALLARAGRVCLRCHTSAEEARCD